VASVDVAVTHGLLVGDAVEQLQRAGVRHLWTSDSVPHPSNCVSVAPLLATALANW
jgi:ribose-phosphate pyrophosphokinase